MSGSSDGRAARQLSVSVVIPARDEEAYIEQTLESVIAQRHPLDAVECVVVDNASRDRTAEVALDFAERHPELRVVVVHEPTAGVGRAKNRGALAAQGDVLLFVDADSRLEPTLLGDVVERYRTGDPAGCIKIVADSDDLLERGFFALNELGKSLFGIRTQMAYCSRPLFFETGGFRTELRVAEDLEFLGRVKKHLGKNGRGQVCYVTSSSILTSPRRLRVLPYRLSVVTVFLRWALAFARVGRGWRY